MSELDEVRGAFIQLWGRLAPLWGITPTAGRILACLIARDGSADGDALAEELEMSRGAVSMATRELIDWGLVHPERPTGSRRVTYRAETDLERAIKAIIQARKRKEWDPLRENLAGWIERLRRDRSPEAATLRHRFEEVADVIGLVNSMATAFLGGGILQRFGLKTLVSAARHRTRKVSR